MVKNIINQALDEYSQQVYGPEGIAYNSPNKLQYDIDANAAAARVPSTVVEKAFPGAIGQGLGFLSDLAMPALALGSSPFYDTYQAIGRAKQANPVDTGPYAGIVDDMEVPAGPTMGQLVNAIRNENIIDSAIGRTLGAGQNLANRFSNIGTAQAAEVTPDNEPLDIEDFLGTSTPKDLGFIGMAPVIKEAVAPVGITDRNRGQIDPFAAERARLVEAGIDPMSVGLDGGTGDPNRPTMADIAGMGDLGNPTGDPRVVSEEMGMVGGRPVSTGRPTMADIAGEINENLRDLGNPTGDPRVVSEEQGLSGLPGIGPDAMGIVDPGFQNALREAAIAEELEANQLNPDYGQFFRAAPLNQQPRGLASMVGRLAGPALTAAGFDIPGKMLSAINVGRSLKDGTLGNAVSRVKTGLGSLNRKMRGVNPDGTTRTQRQYEQARANRQRNARIDNMLDRKAAGKSYSQKNLNELTMGSRPGFYDKPGGDTGGGGGGKSIVCTAMYQTTGLQDWKKAMKIWYIYQKKHLTNTHQEGYHWLFKPFVKAMKKSKIVEALGAHVAKHRTQELKHILFNSKSDKLGKVYNMILEPLCFIAGKIKSALGRG